jgi:hypothetical protein
MFVKCKIKELSVKLNVNFISVTCTDSGLNTSAVNFPSFMARKLNVGSNYPMRLGLMVFVRTKIGPWSPIDIPSYHY